MAARMLTHLWVNAYSHRHTKAHSHCTPLGLANIVTLTHKIWCLRIYTRVQEGQQRNICVPDLSSDQTSGACKRPTCMEKHRPGCEVCTERERGRVGGALFIVSNTWGSIFLQAQCYCYGKHSFDTIFASVPNFLAPNWHVLTYVESLSESEVDTHCRPNY